MVGRKVPGSGRWENSKTLENAPIEGGGSNFNFLEGEVFPLWSGDGYNPEKRGRNRVEEKGSGDANGGQIARGEGMELKKEKLPHGKWRC